jgi:hypothetical protein
MESKFEEIIQNYEDFKGHQQQANQYIDKVFMTKRQVQSKLTCLIYNMLAKNDSNQNRFEVFTTLVYNHYQIWVSFKSEAFGMPGSGSQDHQMKFMRIHQFHAIKILFPGFLGLLFPGYDGSEWWDHNLILCGLMSKKDGQYYFLNNRFCAFFVADFLYKNFISIDHPKKLPGKAAKYKNSSFVNPDSPKIDLFLNILTNQKFKIIRVFLNDIINFSVLTKTKPSLKKFIIEFDKMDNFSEFFTDDLEDLADFIIATLMQGNYKTVKSIIFKNAVEIMTHAKNPKMFLKFQDFLLEFLKVDDLKDLKNLIQNVEKSEFNAKLLQDFQTRAEKKLA